MLHLALPCKGRFSARHALGAQHDLCTCQFVMAPSNPALNICTHGTETSSLAHVQMLSAKICLASLSSPRQLSRYRGIQDHQQFNQPVIQQPSIPLPVGHQLLMVKEKGNCPRGQVQSTIKTVIYMVAPWISLPQCGQFKDRQAQGRASILGLLLGLPSPIC